MPIVSIDRGKIRSLKIEYNMTEHCNYGCDQCSHLSPYMAKKDSSFDDFKRDLAALARVMRVHRFRFVGGEPLLHRRLLEHVAAVRASGFATEIQVCTNGAMLDRTPDEVLAAIDTLTVSWYPDPGCDRAKIDRAVERCKRLGTRVGVLRVDRFRRMQVARPIEDRKLVQDIYDTCEIAHTWYCQTFYEGRFYLCSRPIFTGAYLGKLGTPAPDFRAIDGIPLHEPHLKERLREALVSRRPLASCRYCLGTVGRNEAWRQLAPGERKAPQPPVHELDRLLDRRLLAWRRVARLPPLRALLLFLPRFAVGRAADLFSISLKRS
jgi:organic radical activating enzyme